MKKNAIILAAGKSSRFAPFTYEKPKGLFCVKGEILIERQIEQLREAGVDDIYVVVGYMKEKFFYLESKYGVHILVNNTFAKKGNIYSLYIAREYLANTYICCVDHYFSKNPFVDKNAENRSYRACARLDGEFREFAVEYSDASVITDMHIGGCNQMAMVGQAYFNEDFSKRFRELLENEIDDFGVDAMFWEEFYNRHMQKLTLYMKECVADSVWEFESIDDLRRFDSDFLLNVDSRIVDNICATLDCEPNQIVDIQVIRAGLTNVSFRFTVNGKMYVYRHPGGTSGNLIDRRTELFAQQAAKRLELDKSVIRMDESGWKISYFVPDIMECDFSKYAWQLQRGLSFIRKIHTVSLVGTDVKTFDTFGEGMKLLRIAAAAKGNLEDEFGEIIAKVKKLDALLKADAKDMGLKPALCHNDVYEPNYIATKDHDFYLIDWEYAGVNDPANDISCIFSRYDFTDKEIDAYLKLYFGRRLSDREYRHYRAYIPLNAFYWFCWGLYKGSVGDDDGFFFLPAYRNCVRFVDKALSMFDEEKFD